MRTIVDAGIYVEGEITEEIIRLLVPALLEMVTTLKQERRAKKTQQTAVQTGPARRDDA
jgi:hypothetical protein